MPVFISYAYEDKEFAHELAVQLVRHRAYVWIDEWELNVGDSLVERIQAALTEASALLVLLSPASVESEWCKKELNAGILRELQEKRVVVLPVLVRDCAIPLLLREKVYADFRSDFDAGMRKVTEALARLTTQDLGRIEDVDWHVDWSMDWDFRGERFEIIFTLVEQARDQPFSCLTEIKITGNERARERYVRFASAGLEWFARTVILEMLAEKARESELRVLLEDQRPKKWHIEARDGAYTLNVDLSARRLGEDTGRDILLDLGEELRRIRDANRSMTRPLTAEEQQLVYRLSAELG